jgi:hypothetical protein
MPTATNSNYSTPAKGVTVINVGLKAKYSFYSTLVFFLVANPETFKLTQRLFGRVITMGSESGCPTAYGFFIHSLLFFLVLWGMMLFPRDP